MDDIRPLNRDALRGLTPTRSNIAPVGRQPIRQPSNQQLNQQLNQQPGLQPNQQQPNNQHLNQQPVQQPVQQISEFRPAAPRQQQQTRPQPQPQSQQQQPQPPGLQPARALNPSPVGYPAQQPLPQAANPQLAAPMPPMPAVHPQPISYPTPQPLDTSPSISRDMSRGVPLGQPANSRNLTPIKQPSLPKGIYIIGGFVLVDLLIAFLGLSHVATAPYIFAMVVELLVVVGLFSRVNTVRKVAIVYQGLSVLLISFAIISLAHTQIQTSQLSSKYNSTVAAAGTVASQQQETTIDNLTTQINQNNQQSGKFASAAYAGDLLAIMVSLGVIWYLVRPGVKKAFR